MGAGAASREREKFVLRNGKEEEKEDVFEYLRAVHEPAGFTKPSELQIAVMLPVLPGAQNPGITLFPMELAGNFTYE